MFCVAAARLCSCVLCPDDNDCWLLTSPFCPLVSSSSSLTFSSSVLSSSLHYFHYFSTLFTCILLFIYLFCSCFLSFLPLLLLFYNNLFFLHLFCPCFFLFSLFRVLSSNSSSFYLIFLSFSLHLFSLSSLPPLPSSSPSSHWLLLSRGG